MASIKVAAPADVFERLPFVPANKKPLSDQTIDRVVFGHWGDEVREDVVVCRTSPVEFEVHCHGGDAAGDRILRDTEAAGCRVVEWREFAEFSQGKLGAELDLALSHALTLKAADFLLAQRNGVFRDQLEAIRFQLELLKSDTSVGKEPLDVDACAGVVECVDEMLKWSDFGQHLTEPWHVVLAGRPNVGKSSLINALVGYARAIVSDMPGTTRDLVTAETAFDGWPVRLIDTAGQRESTDEIEAIGVELAREQLSKADCAIVALDVGQPAHEDERALIEASPGCIVLAHKCDLSPHPAAAIPASAIAVSSTSGVGVTDLIEAIVQQLVPETPPIKQAFPVTEWQVRSLRKIRLAVENADLPTAINEADKLLLGG